MDSLTVNQCNYAEYISTREIMSMSDQRTNQLAYAANYRPVHFEESFIDQHM